jgi:hypothetical protein
MNTFLKVAVVLLLVVGAMFPVSGDFIFPTGTNTTGVTFGDMAVSNDLTVAGVIYAEDDVSVAGNIAVNGTVIDNGAIDGDVNMAADKDLTLLDGTGYIQAPDLYLSGLGLLGNAKINGTTYGVGDVSTDGLLTAEAAKINGTLFVVGNTATTGTATFGDTVTVNSTKTLAVITADKLTVGGVILPQEMVITAPITKAMITGGEANTTIFTADDAWTITSIEEVHGVAESTAATLGVDVMKCTGTQAPASGTNLTEAAFNLKGTAETVQTGTLSTTAGVTTLANGNRIALYVTMTEVADAAEFRAGSVTVHMKRV